MDKAKSDSSKPEIERVPCNFFQSVATSLNVRYCGGVSFPPRPAQSVVSGWFQSVAQHGAHSQLVLVAMNKEQPDRVRPFLVRQKLAPGSKQSINFATPSVDLVRDRSLSEVVRDNLYPDEDIHPSGPARSFLYVNDKQEVEYLVVNVSVALWDPTTLKSILETFIGYMHSPRAPTDNPYCKLGGWEKFIQESITAVPEPPFLAVGETGSHPLTIGEVLPAKHKSENIKDRRLTAVIENDIVSACSTVCEKNTVELKTLGMATLSRALAETYFSYFKHENIEDKVTLAQATQIDPRSMFPSDEPKKYLNAAGSLTIGRTFAKKEFEEESVTDWLVKEAIAISEQLTTRMKRGEGARRVLEVVTGNIVQEHHVLAVSEWTDHGIYDTRTNEFSVELGHRFDKCPQMTIVSHIEKASGVMRLEVQMSEGQDFEATKELFRRVAELWKLVAATL